MGVSKKHIVKVKYGYTSFERKHTKLWTFAAVDIEWQITLLLIDIIVVEHHTVRAQFFGYMPITACIVLVALFRIGKVPVGLRTIFGQLWINFFGCSCSRSNWFTYWENSHRAFPFTNGTPTRSSTVGLILSSELTLCWGETCGKRVMVIVKLSEYCQFMHSEMVAIKIICISFVGNGTRIYSESMENRLENSDDQSKNLLITISIHKNYVNLKAAIFPRHILSNACTY